VYQPLPSPGVRHAKDCLVDRLRSHCTFCERIHSKRCKRCHAECRRQLYRPGSCGGRKGRSGSCTHFLVHMRRPTEVVRSASYRVRPMQL